MSTVCRKVPCLGVFRIIGVRILKVYIKVPGSTQKNIYLEVPCIQSTYIILTEYKILYKVPVYIISFRVWGPIQGPLLYTIMKNTRFCTRFAKIKILTNSTYVTLVSELTANLEHAQKKAIMHVSHSWHVQELNKIRKYK